MYRTLQRLFNHTVQTLHKINIKYCEECRRKIMQELITSLACQFNHISGKKNKFGWCRKCHRFLTRNCICIARDSTSKVEGCNCVCERERERERERVYERIKKRPWKPQEERKKTCYTQNAGIGGPLGL